MKRKTVVNTIIVVMVCALLSVCLLTGCGSKPTSESTNGTVSTSGKVDTTNEVAQTPSDSEKVTLTFVNWGDGTEQKMFEDVFSRFSAEHPNIEVKYLFVPWGEYMTKLNTMAASNTMPDLGQMIEHSSLTWAENGMFVDVKDLYESGEIAPRVPAVTFNETKNGFLGSSFIQEVVVLFYDKDVVNAAGVKMPEKPEEAWNWEEFIEAAQKLTVDENGKHPNESGFNPNKIKMYGVADVIPSIMALSNGGGFFSPDGKEIWLDKPETIEAVQKVADLINVYHVMPNPTVRDAIAGGNNPLMTKKVAMHMGGQYCLLWYGDFIQKGELNLGMTVLPKMKNLVTINSGPAIVIFKDSKHIPEAKELLKYFYKTENIVNNIHQGLWMPSEEQWYTDENLISRWVDESPIHPKEYKTAVIPMAREYVVPNPFYKIGITNELDAIINPALDQVWLGNKTAEEVIVNEIMPKIKPIFDKYWAERN